MTEILSYVSDLELGAQEDYLISMLRLSNGSKVAVELPVADVEVPVDIPVAVLEQVFFEEKAEFTQRKGKVTSICTADMVMMQLKSESTHPKKCYSCRTDMFYSDGSEDDKFVTDVS